MGAALLHRVVRDNVSEEVTLELRPKLRGHPHELASK